MPDTQQSAVCTTPAPGAGLRAALVRRLEAGELDLPLLPDTAAQVVAICSDNACDARRLAEMIERDQGLAGHIMRVANSAAYAPREPIVSLKQAISRLGFGTLCDMAFAIALKGRVFSVRGYEQKIRAEWAHSAAAGFWAKEIARLRRRNVEGAFLYGLLHDVGRPVVLQAAVDLAPRAVRNGAARTLDTLCDELHARFGAALVERWSLPEWMVAAVAFHHDPASAGEYRDEALTACLADVLAHWCLGSQDAEVESELLEPLLAALSLYSDELDALLAQRDQVLRVVEAFA
jgi:HD-like signal output (HDOD) protein